jgi:putative ABC transport system substrate-binding protein
MRRREFIAGLGSAAAWPLAARAQQPTLPVVAYINGGTLATTRHLVAAFGKGLSEMGYIDGRNVTVEHHFLNGQFDRLPALMADLVRRRVAVIAPLGTPPAALSAKAATPTIPIVFALGNDPVRLGLVASFAQPGGNVTGVNFFAQEITTKQLGLLHELVPKAVRIGALVNPANPSSAEVTVRDVQDAARVFDLQAHVFNASTALEIDAAFAAMGRERIDALLTGGDPFLYDRGAQIITLAARDQVPVIYGAREHVEIGGLISYGANLAVSWRQAGIYVGSVLKGTKPADLPVMQATRFEFLINLSTARALGIEVPPTLLAAADEVIE